MKQAHKLCDKQEKKQDSKITSKHTIVFAGDEPPATHVKKYLIDRLFDLANYMEKDVKFLTCHLKKEYLIRHGGDKNKDTIKILSMMIPIWVNTVIEKPNIKISSYIINGNIVALPPGQQDYINILESEIPGCAGIYDDNGDLMALATEKSVYILNDIMHCSCEDDLITSAIVFEHIIDRSVRIWNS